MEHSLPLASSGKTTAHNRCNLSADVIADICSKSREGQSNHKLATEYSVGRCVIARVLKENGVESRYYLSEGDELRAVDLYEAGKSAEEVARIVGRAPRTVLELLRRRGICVNTKTWKLTAQQKSDIVTVYQLGESSVSIGAQYKIKPQSVLRTLHSRNVQIRSRDTGLPAHLKACPRCKGVKNKEEDFYKSSVARTTRKAPATYCKECAKTASRKQGLLSRRKIKMEMIEAYGGKCVCCGESHWEFLSIDHIDGKGGEHRRELKLSKGLSGIPGGGHQFYNHLKRLGWPKENFRLLCMNCNCARGFLGYCPHEREKPPL